jgi:hypothetical protein
VLISLYKAGWIEITYLLTTPSDLTDDHELLLPIEDEYHSTFVAYTFFRSPISLKNGGSHCSGLCLVLFAVDLTSADASRYPSFPDIGRCDIRVSIEGRRRATPRVLDGHPEPLSLLVSVTSPSVSVVIYHSVDGQEKLSEPLCSLSPAFCTGLVGARPPATLHTRCPGLYIILERARS